MWISHDLRERTRSIKVGSRQRKDRIVSHITDVLAWNCVSKFRFYCHTHTHTHTYNLSLFHGNFLVPRWAGHVHSRARARGGAALRWPALLNSASERPSPMSCHSLTFTIPIIWSIISVSGGWNWLGNELWNGGIEQQRHLVPPGSSSP